MAYFNLSKVLRELSPKDLDDWTKKSREEDTRRYNAYMRPNKEIEEKRRIEADHQKHLKRMDEIEKKWKRNGSVLGP